MKHRKQQVKKRPYCRGTFNPGDAVVLIFVYLINCFISETTSSKVRVVFA